MNIPGQLPTALEPQQIARQALEALPLAERRQLMRLHRQGVDTAPLLQEHLEAEIGEFQRQRAEFMETAAENIRRIGAASHQLAEELANVGYLDSLEIQIQTFSQAIQDLNPISEQLSATVESTKMSVQERTAKVQALTASLNQLQKQLSSHESRHTAVISGIYAFGDNAARHVVGADYAPSPSSKNGIGLPTFNR